MAAEAANRGLDDEALFSHEFKLEQAREAYKLFDQQKLGRWARA